jgi:hypothetical protein
MSCILKENIKMKPIYSALTALGAALAVTTAQAEDGTQGPGAQSCQKWLEARQQGVRAGKQNSNEIATGAWLQGYLSGLNVAVSNFQKLRPVALPPLETIEAAVAKRCVEVPQVNVDDAAGWYWVNLSEKAVRVPPKQ